MMAAGEGKGKCVSLLLAKGVYIDLQNEVGDCDVSC